MSMVRLALVTSVAWTPPSLPPVRFQMTQVSGLPNTASPRSAASRTPGDVVEDPRILPPEKYVAGGSPVRERINCASERPASALMIRSVRVSCHTIALYQGWPVFGFQTIVVSRWLVTPIAARSRAVMFALRIARGDHFVGARGDLERIVLDPAGLRQDLRVLELVAGDLVAAVVEHHEAGAGRSLVERADVTGHVTSCRIRYGIQAGAGDAADDRADDGNPARSPSRTIPCRGSAGWRARCAGRGRAPD